MVSSSNFILRNADQNGPLSGEGYTDHGRGQQGGRGPPGFLNMVQI